MTKDDFENAIYMARKDLDRLTKLGNENGFLKKGVKQKTITEKDEINTPPHYSGSNIEPIEVIVDWGLMDNHALANVVKYIARRSQKGDYLTNIKKAQFYIDFYLLCNHGGFTAQQAKAKILERVKLYQSGVE